MNEKLGNMIGMLSNFTEDEGKMLGSAYFNRLPPVARYFAIATDANTHKPVDVRGNTLGAALVVSETWLQEAELNTKTNCVRRGRQRPTRSKRRRRHRP